MKSTIVKRGDLKSELTLSGEIGADEKAVLRFQTGGLLSWVGVKEGGYVQKYRTIAILDQRSVRKNLDKKLNDYSKTRADFDETKDDYKDKILTDEIKRILEKSQYDLNNSVIDVELQDLSLKLSTITTPIEGIVTKVETPFSGINISATQAPFEVVNPKSIYFKVTADQTEITSLHENQEGKIVFDAYPDDELEASIDTISFSPETDESGTVYAIKVSLGVENADYKYKLGMTGDITFIIDEKQNVLYLPIQYIKSDEKGKYVLKGNNKEKTYVKTGLETNTEIETTSGLNEGEVVYE
jgi:RND family efflux transporter MFP subunit